MKSRSAFLFHLAVLLFIPSLLFAKTTLSFRNNLGTNFLKISNGEVLHALNDSPLQSVNDETSKAEDGNRLLNVISIDATGFADLPDIHVVAVNRKGDIFHTIRRGDGTWFRWGNIKNEINFTGKAVDIKCRSQGRTLFITVDDANGSQKRARRNPDGTWKDITGS